MGCLPPQGEEREKLLVYVGFAGLGQEAAGELSFPVTVETHQGVGEEPSGPNKCIKAK